MRRGYLRIGERRVHVLAGGRGPVVVLLHSLPQCALELRALGDSLAQRHAVVVPDLAGCGLSDPLPAGACEVADLAADLGSVLARLEVRSCAIHARGNAAPIALALRERLGGQVTGIVLEDPQLLDRAQAAGYARFSADEFAPEPSGAHLVRLWDRVRTDCQFWPPHLARSAQRLDRDMPDADGLEQRALGWLRAGRNARGVLAAVARQAELASDARVPERVRTVSARAGERPAATAVAAALGELCGADALDLRDWRAPIDTSEGFAPAFVPVKGGYLHARLSLSGKGRPVVALHDPAGTSELVLSFSSPLVPDRPVVALDLPGNGESDNTLGTDEPTSATCAEVVAQALDALGLGEVDLVGRYSGGPIGMELEFRSPGRIRHLVQAGITTYEPDEARRLLERYTPSIAPVEDGSHLLRAWHIMKSQALYWPWFDQSREGIIRGEPQLDPALIHRRVVDLLKCGDLYRKAYAALWTYPLAERLPRLQIPTLLCAPAWDPLYPHLGKAAAAGPQCRVATLPDRFQDWHRCLVPFFEDRLATAAP